MTDQTPWKGDPKQRKTAVRFGLALFFLLFIVMTITSLSRYFGW
jgi:hypothetical protein